MISIRFIRINCLIAPVGQFIELRLICISIVCAEPYSIVVIKWKNRRFELMSTISLKLFISHDASQIGIESESESVSGGEKGEKK